MTRHTKQAFRARQLANARRRATNGMSAKGLVRRIAWGALLLCLAGLTFGYFGALHPAADSLAVFRLGFAIGAMAIAFALRRDRRAALCGGAATLALGMSWLDTFPNKQDWAGHQEIVVYQQNLMVTRQTYEALLAEILAQDPDVITFQEVSPGNLQLLEDLRDQYPIQQTCNIADIVGAYGVAVLAKAGRVTERLKCSGSLGVAAMRVDAGPGPIWFVSLHLPWPWPYSQPELVEVMTKSLLDLQAPVLLAGDFNAVGWSHAVQAIADAGGMARVGRDVFSFSLPITGYPVGIDHVLATGGRGEVTVMPKFASDHHGILAHVYLPR